MTETALEAVPVRKMPIPADCRNILRGPLTKRHWKPCRTVSMPGGCSLWWIRYLIDGLR